MITFEQFEALVPGDIFSREWTELDQDGNKLLLRDVCMVLEKPRMHDRPHPHMLTVWCHRLNTNTKMTYVWARELAHTYTFWVGQEDE